jgi:hypothetical protein
MSSIVEFPTADREDKLHAEAFCDLEREISDLESMGKIAAHLMVSADDGTNRELVFAVLHLSEMLTAFKANYYAAWHGEKQQGAS